MDSSKILLLFYLTCQLYLTSSMPLDFFLDPPETGFFLKPIFKGHEIYSMNVVQRHFMVWQPRGQVSVKAVSESYTATKQLPAGLLRDALNNQTGVLLNHIFIDGMDISAHVVSPSLTPDRPLLQVLFHSSSLVAEPLVANKTMRQGGRKEGRQRQTVPSKWCLQVHAEKANRELIGSCVLDSRESVCIAEVKVPPTWWDTHQTQTVSVFYSVLPWSEIIGACMGSNVTHGATAEHEHLTSMMSTVTLTTGQLTYQELKEDQHILVYIPRRSFYLGSVIRVPVKLQAGSDLGTFVVRVKTRQGVRVVGAESNNPRWTITVDASHRKYGGAVTAQLMDGVDSAADRLQEPVFDWVFEVEEDTGEERGRVSFSLEYERGNQGTVSNKVQAFIDIQHDNIYAIVPVIKTTEILNTAVLTGKTLTFPMKIFSVSQGGKMSDVTAHTTCHSADDDVLKVAQSCHMVYVDGTESKGGASVSVIAKYGPHTKFLFFRVWTPQLPLTIDLSDNRLSLVKDWIVPTRRTGPASRRVRRGVEFGIVTNKEQLLEEEGVHVQAEDLTSTCHPAYQQAVVEVYASFAVPDDTHHQYLIHRKALLRVTDLVMGALRVANPAVASLRGNIVEGLKPGLTDIHVLGQSGKELGSRELRVTSDKVTIDELLATLVTGLSFELAPEHEFPGVLVANINRSSRFLRKGEEGIVDLTLRFSDGAQLPLHHVNRDDYYLDLDTLNSKVITFASAETPEGAHVVHQTTLGGPRVQAVGQGQGKLVKITLDLGDQCQGQTKQMHTLAVATVEGVVEFPEDTQSDISVYPSVRERGGDLKAQRKIGSGGKSSTPAPINDSLMITSSSGHSPTALEIAMYVLLGFFCVAVAVFMVNCFVFGMRYRCRRKGTFKPTYAEASKGTVTQARDWVWIGRDTLERNAISTGCSNSQQPTLTLPNQGSTPHVLTASFNNRQSASLCKSSERSIRITANPLIVPDSMQSSCIKDESEAGEVDSDDDGADCEECAMMRQQQGDDDDAASCDECHRAATATSAGGSSTGHHQSYYGNQSRAEGEEISPRDHQRNISPLSTPVSAATLGEGLHSNHVAMSWNKSATGCRYDANPSSSWRKAMEDKVLWNDGGKSRGCWVPADPDDTHWNANEHAQPLLTPADRTEVADTHGGSVRTVESDSSSGARIAARDKAKTPNGLHKDTTDVPYEQLMSYFDNLRESTA